MKRLFDLLISILVLIAISPLLLITSVLVKITSEGPIFFTQERLGKDGNTFKMYKFRTMIHSEREFGVQITSASSDVTLIGRIIRRLKIDELPQLYNVLKGNMSLVGPRPCLPSLLRKFNTDAQQRLKVKPGLTGLAQINGNIHLTWEERWALDKQYVEEQSLLLDLKILFKTILVVLFGEKWGDR